MHNYTRKMSTTALVMAVAATAMDATTVEAAAATAATVPGFFRRKNRGCCVRDGRGSGSSDGRDRCATIAER